MVAYAAVCERLKPNQGRNKNQTYVNVVSEIRTLNNVNSVAQWLSQNPGHPWNDGGFNEFIVELTQQEYNDIQNGNDPLTWDNKSNLPRWQQQTAGSGSTKSFGSFADPTDAGSVFTTDIVLEDDRWIVRIYDNDPLTTGVHLGTEEIDQDRASPNRLRYLRLFNSNDTPSSTNATNQRTEIGGRLMDFDFTNGIATFTLLVEDDGTISFPSNGLYRIVGPAGEKSYTVKIFGKFLYPI